MSRELKEALEERDRQEGLCANCAHFEPSPNYGHLGQCTVTLPPFVAHVGDRTIRVDDHCDLHKEKQDVA